MILIWVWTFVYIMALPSIAAHLVIINSIFRFKRFNRPINYFLAYLSICAVFRQIISGVYLLDMYIIRRQTSLYCAMRAINLRLPAIIIAFTLVKLVRERSRISGNPNYNPSQWKVLKDIIVLTFTAILLLLPFGFNKVYDSTLQTCYQVMLFGSVPIELTYRFIYLLTVNLIPSIMLFGELRRMVKRLHSWEREDDPGDDAYSQFMFMRTSCVFIFFFIMIFLPSGLIDATQTEALNMPTTMKWVQRCVLHGANICSYILFSIYPVYIIRIYRKCPYTGVPTV